MRVAVLGAGAFGTALGIVLARGDASVTLWARDALQAQTMANDRENRRRLAGAAFPDQLGVTSDLAAALEAEVVLLALPMQQLAAFVSCHGRALAGKMLVACCKGIDLESGLGPVSVIRRACPDTVAAVLTGPSFAQDIAAGLPTALTLACTADALTLQQVLSTGALRIYRTGDVVGAELGGALKNVMAIACGAAMGAGLGDSARAALITRGFAEMQRMALGMGAQAQTLAGLSGFGDLVLTCTSEGSRNYRYGLSLGRGCGFDASVTVEGAATARAVLRRAGDMDLEMPITQAVCNVMDGRLTVGDALDGLLSRPLRAEVWDTERTTGC